MWIDIAGCNISLLGNYEMHSLIGGTPLLKGISCDELFDEHLAQLGRNCVDLEYLKLRYSKSHITDYGVAALTMGCHKLLTMDFSFSYRLTNTSLNDISLNCKSLQSLTINGDGFNDCAITNIGFWQLGKECKQLRELTIQYAPNVSNVGVKLLSLGCLHMKKLVLNGTSCTPEAVNYFTPEQNVTLSTRPRIG